MSSQNVFAKLGSKASLSKIKDAESKVPRKQGLYSINIDRVDALPAPFADALRERGSHLLYIGIASRSLLRRLIQQDLRHRSPSTFFRGVGAMLGYRPPAGSLRGKANKRNYKFTEADTGATTSWVAGTTMARRGMVETGY